MNLKAGIYVRVSTEEQRDYGYSIDGQLRELKYIASIKIIEYTSFNGFFCHSSISSKIISVILHIIVADSCTP